MSREGTAKYAARGGDSVGIRKTSGVPTDVGSSCVLFCLRRGMLANIYGTERRPESQLPCRFSQAVGPRSPSL
jgi:hypothetical protein